MSQYEVREKRLTPEEVDYLQTWIDEHCKQETRETLEKDDGIGVFRACLWAVPVGLVFWAGVVWWLW